MSQYHQPAMNCIAGNLLELVLHDVAALRYILEKSS